MRERGFSIVMLDSGTSGVDGRGCRRLRNGQRPFWRMMLGYVVGLFVRTELRGWDQGRLRPRLSQAVGKTSSKPPHLLIKCEVASKRHWTLGSTARRSGKATSGIH
jgi:hypothetical protein